MNALRGCWGAALVALLLVLAKGSADAHPVQFTTLQVQVERDGDFLAILNIDILAFALHKTSEASTNEELQAELDAPRSTLARDLADADLHFQHELVMRTDAGDATVSTWKLPGLPEVNAVLALNLHPSILMPGEIRFSGKLPIQAKTLKVRLPYVLGDTVHVYELPGGDTSDQPVLAGAYSAEVAISLQPDSAWRNLARNAGNGFAAMTGGLPDHLLFVLALFFFSTRLAPLLRQVAAFTASHTLGLWLAGDRLIHISHPLVETLIAVSVLVLALDNFLTGELKPWRLPLIFGFGLFHGLAFAHLFIRDTLPRDENFAGLAGFNLGLELGQLAILVAAFVVLGAFRHCAWYRRRIALPASALIALVALVWTIQRIFWPIQA